MNIPAKRATALVSMCALALLAVCTSGPKPVTLPTLSTAQLQLLTTQVCTALKVDLTLWRGPDPRRGA